MVNKSDKTIAKHDSDVKGVWEKLNKIYRKFSPEIESIRSGGSCNTCGRMRFGKLHVRRSASGKVSYHHDTYDVVTDPFKHILYDYVWQDKILGRAR